MVLIQGRWSLIYKNGEEGVLELGKKRGGQTYGRAHEVGVVQWLRETQ